MLRSKPGLLVLADPKDETVPLLARFQNPVPLADPEPDTEAEGADEPIGGDRRIGVVEYRDDVAWRDRSVPDDAGHSVRSSISQAWSRACQAMRRAA